MDRYFSRVPQSFRLVVTCQYDTAATAAAAKSLQSCPTLCERTDGSPPGSPVPGILQARTLEWVAISFSNAWKWKVKVKSLSHVWLLVTPWTAAYQAPPSMGFSRQEYWSGVPLLSLQYDTEYPSNNYITPLHPTLLWSSDHICLKNLSCTYGPDTRWVNKHLSYVSHELTLFYSKIRTDQYSLLSFSCRGWLLLISLPCW